MKSKTGWKPIPLSLKILFVLIILWTLGSISVIMQRMADGIPFFGMYLSGIAAALIVLILDILAPIGLLYAIWTRKNWGVKIAWVYMGIFILNSLVALFTVRDQLGIGPILGPAIFTIVFLAIVHCNKNYFNN